jgi:enoyl-[acyl-carrier protein] reductase I
MKDLLQGRRGLIIGIANERSLAFGIARACHDQGASLAVTYQSARLERRVLPLARELGAELCLPCDLTSDAEVQAVVEAVRRTWGGLDFLVHAVAHARREELEGRFVETSRDGFVEAMGGSVFSLVKLCRAFEPLLALGSSPSVVTLSYYGGDKAMPSYNVMGLAKAALEAAVRYLAADLGPQGIRVNALSPGPVKTLSAAGVSGLREMLAYVARVSPLRRNVGLDDVGQAALFLLSDLSAATTGDVLFVDSGYNIIGAPPREAKSGGRAP